MTGPPPRLRAVITDIDGTLTDEHRHFHGRAAEVVRQLEESGVPVGLATGNVLPIALAVQRLLGASGPIVAENGGIIFWPSERTGTVERRADRRLALRAWRAVLASGLPAQRLFTDRWRETEVALEATVSVSRVRAAIRGLPVRAEPTGYAIHLIERHVGKLPSLRRALQRIGLSPKECVVLGDGDNDVGMLRAAGFGVSFPSGSPRARAAARYVTRADYADGFEEGVKESGLLA
jgi:phosphoglycolate phosphatase